ncbi:MAG: LPS assembly lipoprotein LptE [Saprospiraceae bacterium]
MLQRTHLVIRSLVLTTFLAGFAGCYSFKGISIDPNDRTFFVKTIETQAGNAPPTMALDFTERLKDKIRQETRLTFNDEKPDIEFTGKLTDYRVELVAPKPGEVLSQNRLIAVYRVNLVNNLDEKRSWPSEKSFQHFAEFPSTEDLLTVQDRLITEINNQILEDIFNAAFNNW